MYAGSANWPGHYAMLFVFANSRASFYRQPGRIYQYAGGAVRGIGQCCDSSVILLTQIVDV